MFLLVVVAVAHLLVQCRIQAMLMMLLAFCSLIFLIKCFAFLFGWEHFHNQQRNKPMPYCTKPFPFTTRSWARGTSASTMTKSSAASATRPPSTTSASFCPNLRRPSKLSSSSSLPTETMAWRSSRSPTPTCPRSTSRASTPSCPWRCSFTAGRRIATRRGCIRWRTSSSRWVNGCETIFWFEAIKCVLKAIRMGFFKEANVIIVGWGNGSISPFVREHVFRFSLFLSHNVRSKKKCCKKYAQSVSNTRVVGKQTSLIVEAIRDHFYKDNATALNVHCIGHSLGAHTCWSCQPWFDYPSSR